MFSRVMLAMAITFGGAAIGGQARAEAPHGLGEWRGTGSTFGPDGNAQGEFQVELTRSATGPTSVETRGRVRLASGQVIPFSQRMLVKADGRFSLDSDHGQGAGFCVGAGLCQSYEDRGNGAGVSTVMIIDAEDTVRVLITELEHGRAARFIRQTLQKQAAR